MSRPWILVCPSSRGIGHALTRHLLRNTTVPILATARSDPSATKDLLLDDIKHDREARGRLSVLRVDVTDESTIEAAAREAGRLFPAETHHLHLGFAIPGILHAERSPRQVSAEDALMTYRVNTLGPLLLMKWFGEFLPRRGAVLAPAAEYAFNATGERQEVRLPPHAVWMAMSARVGSVSGNRKGGWYSYRSSKAAVNSLVRSFDLQLVSRSGDRAMAVAYHPGTVRTDLSREFWESVAKESLFTPEYAVDRMTEVACGKTDASRQQLSELQVQARVAAELKKLQQQEDARLREVADKAAAESVPEQTPISSPEVSKKVQSLRERLESRRNLREVPESVEKARGDVVRCLTENDRRPLDCWKEVESFKEEVRRLERGWVERVIS
ncbi:hypothetical protein SLS53_005222 [Cytospora paraplurivora]|uniref:Uncharacterized protein n=1 Tax=Cytospora paraplurivora TaxID=2898453 RepID=A0AAN9YGC1_9PEZI